MLKIHETTTPSGELCAVHLRAAQGTMELVSAGAALALPDGALDAVMRRFGAPLEDGVKLAVVAELDLGGGRVLRHVRHLARYDVIAKDWLVYDVDGEGALCALATTVAGALDHLARAVRPLSGS